LQRLRFGELEGLAHVRIEVPARYRVHRVRPKRSLMSRLRILHVDRGEVAIGCRSRHRPGRRHARDIAGVR
jgi:hypothetical protein